MSISTFWPSDESWKRYWLPSLVSLIAVIQLLVSFALLAIHGAIVGIGVAGLCIGAAPWFIMGFVCWVFFITCWISIFCVSCCHRSSVGCATYVMITNILAFIFSAVLIDFDNKYINGQADVISGYYSSSCGGSNTYLYGNRNTDFGNIMLGLTKGQLAGSVVILVASLVFVGIYIYTYIRAIRDDGTNFSSSHGQSLRKQPNMVEPSAQVSTPVYHQPVMHQPEPINMSYNRIICPRCGSNIDIPERF